MNKLMLVALMIFCTNAYAEKVHITCYSDNKTIFDKDVYKALQGDGYTIAIAKPYSFVITGDCVIRYKNITPHHHKHIL